MRDEASWRKLTFQEIAALINSRQIDQLFEPIEQALQGVEKRFLLKVTKAWNRRADFTVEVNGKVFIELVRRPELRKRGSIAITPESSRHEAAMSDPFQARIFYVPDATYGRFCQDAAAIYAEYCQDGWNFGAIPCTWFRELDLTRFIRDSLWDDSYFQSRMAFCHVAMLTDWSHELECL